MKTRKEKREIPENIPVITPEMMNKTAIEIAKRRGSKKDSPLKNITDLQCPSCDNHSMDFVDDLIFDVTLAGERVIIPNLTGLKCTKCGEEMFDAGSTKLIEKYTAGRPIGGYECKLTTVGGGKLGLYFPRDIFRVMDIKKSDEVVLTPVSNRKMVIELLNSS